MKLRLSILSVVVLLSSHSAFAAKKTTHTKVPQDAVGAMVAGEARDCVGNACAVSAAVSCDDEPDAEACNVQPTYGGIKQQYVVKGCQVTIYNDGPVQMVNVKTGKWCDAPLPKEHVFHTANPAHSTDTCSIAEADASGAADCAVTAPTKKARH